MNEEQRRILNLLSQGKITPAEAEELMDALRPNDAPKEAAKPDAPKSPKYLRVQVDDPEGTYGSGRVNVRVPFNLLRAGMRLTALLPTVAQEHINKALHDNGVNLDLSKLKPENLEELVEHLGELTVDVDGAKGEKVRVFCE
jgi:hypothetical protein